MTTCAIDHRVGFADPVGSPTQAAAASCTVYPQNQTLTCPSVVPVLPAVWWLNAMLTPVPLVMTPSRIAVTPSAIAGSMTWLQRCGGTGIALPALSVIDKIARDAQCRPCAAKDAYASAICRGAIGLTPRVMLGTWARGAPSARRTPIAAAIWAGRHSPVCFSISMNAVLTDWAVAVRML